MGIARATFCQQFCRTDRMVRLWIELFNRGGIIALITWPKLRPEAGVAPREEGGAFGLANGADVEGIL